MSDWRQWLSRQHPFIVVLYLTAAAVFAVVLGQGFYPVAESDETVPLVEGRLTLPGGVTRVDQLPPLRLSGIDGREHALSEWQGRVILLNFWATWCPPCKYEIPDFIEYQAEYEEEGLQLVGVGVDAFEKVRDYSELMGINYPVLHTDDSMIMNPWGNQRQVLPYSVVIDRQGQIRYLHEGLLFPEVFQSRVLPLLQEQIND